METFQNILKFVSYIFYLLVALIIFFVLTSNFQILGGYQSFLVLSGSMEPTIMTGDIIIINKQPRYGKNDVVTFKDKENRIVTHRIIEEQQNESGTIFITQGDANRTKDNDTVRAESVIGKVVLIVPKLGFLVKFAQTIAGLIIMIIIPTILLVLDQIIKSYRKTNRY